MLTSKARLSARFFRSTAIPVTVKYREPSPGSGSKRIHGQRFAGKLRRESELLGRAIPGNVEGRCDRNYRENAGLCAGI